MHINHHKTINELLNLIQQGADQAKADQYHALEERVDEILAFNWKLNWNLETKEVSLVNNAEELLEVFRLRSEVYTQLNYQDEFPDTVKGLNFDHYDTNAAILFHKTDNQITGTTRVIFDSDQHLPVEEKFSLDDIKKRYNQIGELSRLIVKDTIKGLGLDFKYLMRGIYNVFMHNDINIAISTIKRDHHKLYDKLGGVQIEKELDAYGKLENLFYIISYDPTQASPFFKKVFL